MTAPTRFRADLLAYPTALANRYEVTAAGRAALEDLTPAPRCQFTVIVYHCREDAVGTVVLDGTRWYVCPAHAQHFRRRGDVVTDL